MMMSVGGINAKCEVEEPYSIECVTQYSQLKENCAVLKNGPSIIFNNFTVHKGLYGFKFQYIL